MSFPLLIEELVIDDSFISFCLERDEAAMAFWNAYLLSCPEEENTVKEARALVLNLTRMLTAEQEQLSPENGGVNHLYIPDYDDYTAGKTVAEIFPVKKNSTIKKILAALTIAAVLTGVFFVVRSNETVQPAKIVSPDFTTAINYTTSPAQKQVIYLPDSSKVILNSGSSLSVSYDFGKENRVVTLTGEAYFDVRKNERLPFLVQTQKYFVRVLGTVFNVKDYPGDKASETSLISGKVEIFMRKGTEQYLFKTLKPKEKFILFETDTTALQKKEYQVKNINSVIVPLSYTMQKENVETAWVDNKLIIENEAFADMQTKLERWYNVKLVFRDEEVKQYRFTATFEHEPVELVMKALQASYSFNYTIKENEIFLSK